jgi:RNA polymerase sigma-70 factor (ECF subfamily)
MGEREFDAWFIREVLSLEPQLSRFLKRNWRQEAEVPDLRQEVFARVYESAIHNKPLQTKAFLFRVARNLIIDRLRQQSVVSIEGVADFKGLDVSTEEPSPEEHVTARQELRVLHAAIEELPPRCRQIVLLRKVQGLSQKEVAKQMNISEVTVEHQVAKGIQLLAEAMLGRRGKVISESRRYEMLKKLTTP